MLTFSSQYLWLMLLNGIFVGIVVFSQRRSPAVTWAWLMVITVFPVGGFILYMLIGQDIRKQHVFVEKGRNDEMLLDQYMTHAGEGMSPPATRGSFNLPDAPHLNDVLHLNYFAAGGMYTDNNHVTLFHDGRSKFETMLNDIAEAKDFIFLQYYIMRDDETGRRLIRQLAKRAVEGVEVRLLVDGMGCVFTPKRFYKPLTDAGGHVGVFMPPALIRLNYRNHRKLAVVDGTVGYIGGLNIGNEYLSMTERFGFWRDTHMRLTGDAVQSITLRFIMDWNFTTAKGKLPLERRYFPLANTEPEQDETAHPFRPNTKVRMQIVSSGPDTRYPNVMHGLCKMVTEAERSIYIQTPYFVPDESLFGSLRVAALSGIDVRIMIPGNPDHPFVYWAGLSYLGELLETGVKCYEYEKGFIHSKTLMIDSLACSVGTANMDMRSFKLNFESNAFIYDAGVTQVLEAAFMRDLERCRAIELDAYSKRTRRTKIKESLSRLISPLL